MKKILLLISIVLINSNCRNEYDLGESEIENLIFDERANEQITYDKSLITEEYEEWRYWNFIKMEDDSTKFVQPYFKLKVGEDSIKMSLLPLREFQELEKVKDSFAVEYVIVQNEKITFLPSDFFPEERVEYEINDLIELVEQRYRYSDSLNLKCPEWWIFGREKDDLLDQQIFSSILNGYLGFTKKKFEYNIGDLSRLDFLNQQRENYPFRVSIEEPMCRYGE